MPATTLPEQIADAQTTEERFLRQIFVRDQMAEWSKHPLIMARADGVHYWDVNGKRYLDGLSGIYVVSLGHNNKKVIDAVKRQMDVLCFSPPMHGTPCFPTPSLVRANCLCETLATPPSRPASHRRRYAAGPPLSRPPARRPW